MQNEMSNTLLTVLAILLGWIVGDMIYDNYLKRPEKPIVATIECVGGYEMFHYGPVKERVLQYRLYKDGLPILCDKKPVLRIEETPGIGLTN